MTTQEKEPEIIDLATLKDAPVLETEELWLPVQLTEAEWDEYAAKLAAGAIEIARVESVEKARRSAWTATHKVRESNQLNLAEIVGDRAEKRDVKVLTFALLDGPPDSYVAITVRTDTGEVRDRRALTVDEIDELAQQPLPLPPEPEAAPMPKGVKALAKYIAAGDADDKLSALDADSRKGVKDAMAARREVLLAADIAEAEADKPQKKSL